MKRVYKYNVPIPVFKSGGTIEAPSGRVVLADFNTINPACLTVWIEHFDDEPLHPRRFEIVATGRAYPETWEHITSHRDEAFIWHIFEAPTKGEQ